MLPYVFVFIGSLWGILTLISLREEEKEIKELLDSAHNATRQSHGSE
jgi:hypothetical protein